MGQVQINNSGKKSGTDQQQNLGSKWDYGMHLAILGVSDYFIWENSMAINGELYGNECITKRLIPFIENSNMKDQCLFWPDKASSHYAKSVKKILETAQIQLLPYHINPTNTPQLRPIERAHALLKRAIFADNFQPKNVGQLRKRVEDVMKKSDTILKEIYHDLSMRIRVLCDRARRSGILSVHN